MRSPLSLFSLSLFCTSMWICGCGGGDSAAPPEGATSDAGADGMDPAMDPAAMTTDDPAGEALGGGAIEGDATGEMSGGHGAAGAGDPSTDPSVADAAMTDTAVGTDTGEYDPAMAAGEAGSAYPGSAQPQKPSRPANVATWTREQLLDAVRERDPQAKAAIEAMAGKPDFPALMAEVLAVASGAQPATGAQEATPTESVPQTEPTEPVEPTNGASFNGLRHLQSPHAVGMDSLEVMLGEALVGFVPQAEQATRGAAASIQKKVNERLDVEGAEKKLQDAQADPSAAGSTAAGTDPAMSSPDGTGTSVPPTADPTTDPTTDPAMMEGSNPYGEANPYGAAAGGNGRLQDHEIVAAVVRGLVKTSTPDAWKMIQGMIGGSVPTPLGQEQTAGIVLGEVLSSDAVNPQVAEQLLLAAFRNLPDDPGQKAAATRLVAALAHSSTLHFMGLAPKSAPPAGKPGGPQNASMPGPGAEMAGEYSGAENAEYASAYGAENPGGLPAAAASAAAAMNLTRIPLPEAAMSAVASVLYGPGLGEVLSERLNSTTPEERASAIALAANIPTASARHALFEALSTGYEKGAAELSAAGIFSEVVSDPGFLCVLKSLPRERPPRARSGEGAPEITPGMTWAMATGNTVLALRDRLRKVAEDTSIPNIEDQRVRLHRDAPTPERNIMIKAPSDAAAALGDKAPPETTLYYTRVKVNPQRALEMQDIVDYYEKRIKGFRWEDPARGVLWYDGVKTNPDGTRETMDVVVQQAGNAVAGGYGEEGGQPAAAGGTPYSIEIIVVVTKDPKEVAAASNAAAATAEK
ncbi:MAG: hypothetical protein KDA81_12330 [Planctomycetaceae bacterium]|nr:hypothetical protein [Planctomycetaceae bacterium]